MSAIKNFYHEEICRGFDRANDEHLDDEYFHQKWEEERKAEEENIEQRAEEAEFFRIFERTGTYPM